MGIKDNKSEYLTASKSSIAHKWFKLKYLHHKLLEWGGTSRVKRELDRLPNQCEKFAKELKNLTPDIQLYHDRETRMKESGQRVDLETLQRLENDINEQIDSMLHWIYTLISCVIHARDKLPQQRKAGFEFFGLYPYFPPKTKVDWDTIVASANVVFVATLLPTLLYYFVLAHHATNNPLIPKNPTEALIWAVYSLFMQFLTIIFSVLVFRRLSSHEKNRDITRGTYHGGPSTVIRTLSGVTGYMSGLAAMVVLSMLIRDNSFAEALGRTWMWGFLTATTGIFVAYHLDTSVHRTGEGSRLRLRLKESGIQGGATALVSVIITLIALGKVSEAVEIYFTIFVALTTGLIGAGIGFTFPEGYRKRALSGNRLSERFFAGGQASLRTGDVAHECSLIDISLTGAGINIEVPDLPGSKAELNLPKIGSFPGIIVRKDRQLTFVNFFLDEVLEGRLRTYINSLQPQ
jgi:hypothetical protein